MIYYYKFTINSIPMNKATVIAGAVVMLAAVVLAGASIKHQYRETATPTPTSTPMVTATVSPSPTASPLVSPSPVALLTLSPLTVIQHPEARYTAVTGTVSNTDTSSHSVTITATFYDKNGKVLDSASGVVKDILTGSTTKFTLMSADLVTDYKDVKAVVSVMQ